MLNSVNKPVTALVGIGLLLISLLPNPQFQSAVVVFFSHPSPAQIMSALGTIAGIVALYIARPVGTSPPQGA